MKGWKSVTSNATGGFRVARVDNDLMRACSREYEAALDGLVMAHASAVKHRELQQTRLPSTRRRN